MILQIFSAESAIHSSGANGEAVRESRFQRLLIIRRKSWGDAPG
jgi:hypothetical protein